MEDGDGESEVMDTTSTSADDQCKGTEYEESNSEAIDLNLSSDQIDECRLENYSLSEAEEAGSKSLNPGSKINYKGFKKRILAQTQESQATILRNETQERQLQKKKFNLRSGRDKKSDTKRGKITEYAQYLGLQPAAKYKCLKCQSGATFCTMSMLKQHQKTCTTSTITPMQGVLGGPESSSMPMSPNFRITRKVYLCSACGTYFENWNLFLHMREVHKRHICLFCLGMFGQAERLSYHLSSKHSVPETEFQSVEDFYNSFKGSCYLICCNCEKVFSETDDFYNHFCSMPQKQSTSSVCSVCRQTDSHASSCTLALENRLGTENSTPQPSNSNSSIRAHALPTVGSGKGTSKRVIRNNRLKITDSLKTTGSSPGKLFKAQKIAERIQPDAEKNQDIIENNQRISESSDTELKIDISRDTVAETIMEVSRYIEGGDINAIAGVSGTHKEEEKDSKSPREFEKQNYDSVTETIMEVSRFHEDSSQVPGDNCGQEIDGVNRMREAQKIMDMVNRRDSVSLSVNVELDDRLNLASLAGESSEKKKESETPLIQDSGNLPRSQTLGSPVMSPTAHSLFSPQHEVQTLDVNLRENRPKEFPEKVEPEEPAAEEAEEEEEEEEEEQEEEEEEQEEEEEEEEEEEDEELDESTEKEELCEPSESQTSVSFNTVAATDRSLVIKICTNRVSKISVATTNAVAGNNENNHNTSRESEENNNGEGSTSEEKASNLSEREREGPSDYQINPEESDSDSDKLAVVLGAPEEPEEQAEGVEGENISGSDQVKDGKQEKSDVETDGIVLAGEEVPSIDLNVEGTMESLEIDALLKHCIAAASPTCVYCNHARQIAVNGKQLGLHMLAEHRFLPQHPAIIIQREQFISRLKKALPEVETYFFNYDSYNTTEGTYNVPKSRTYECFHCRFHSAVHKELYLHNRKMHQKTILICIMCKSTFYSYSELLCHLCPGVYSPNINVKYRCCLCPTNNLPSAFRLMVHLRKRHHACDVCLEATGNQQRLSNHVWKHKLHHLCYRCGIAYRNKPDITKHLFWKHGTESVLCKKCLQKKWPHVYHFCIPPTAFVCEECGSSFSRAVALKVHKRLHSGDKPYSCETCSMQFISKKLMLKHQEIHKEQVEVRVDIEEKDNHESVIDEEGCVKDDVTINEDVPHSLDGAKDGKESVKKVVDVYDLPPLNLSSESDSESDTEKVGPSNETNKATSAEGKIQEEHKSDDGKSAETRDLSSSEPNETPIEIDPSEDEKKEVVQIIDGIWDNFKSYTASLEMKESSNKTSKNSETDIEILRSIILADHDYCVVYSEKDKTDSLEDKDGTSKPEDSVTGGGEDDYINKPLKSPERQSGDVQSTGCENESGRKKPKTPRKKKQSGSTSSSDSSSDSDSSNCSCGTNCSCSSSSSGSSSSSSSSSDSDSSVSEGSPRKQTNRKDRKKVKDLTKKNKSDSVEIEAKATEAPAAEVAAAVATEEPTTPVQIENGTSPTEVCNPPNPLPETLLRESDLDTDETETDEDFYDEHPQQLANKLLAEKRNQLMLLAAVAPASTDIPAAAPLNNGAIEAEERVKNHVPVPMLITATAPAAHTPQPKKKVKTKKRKKNEKAKQQQQRKQKQQQQQRTSTPTVESIKLNIPKSFYQTKQGFTSSSPAFITVIPSRSSTPNLSTPAAEIISGKESQIGKSSTLHAVGSGSETDNKRSSKRKRVPKRFYGDSSGEENEKQPVLKWRKIERPTLVTTPGANARPPQTTFTGNSTGYNTVIKHVETPPAPQVSESESEAQAESSSDSSESDTESQQQQPQQQQPQQQQPQQQQPQQQQLQQQLQQQPQPQQQQEQQHYHQPQQQQPQLPSAPPHHPPQQHSFNTENNAPVLERSDNLYCYCQCPYDEVSEMIACDGDDCRIEWFHFECVGIMVPPKGKWYCPDCRKKHGVLNSNEDYFD